MELFGFAANGYFASTSLSFLAVNLDKLILGKLMTLAELGLYSIALTFAKVAINVVSRLSNAVISSFVISIQRNQTGNVANRNEYEGLPQI